MRAFHEPTRLSVSAHLVDARGLACPRPIVELARALRAHPVVELWADDPAAGADLLAFCEATGHHLSEPPDAGRPLRAVITRTGSKLPQV
jgi:TusA-related sulfurtransferase